MRLLCFDIGNSFIKTGIFDDEKLIEFNKFRHSEFSEEVINSFEFDSSAISSVVPEQTEKIRNYLAHNPPFIIEKSCRFNLTIDYKTPETLGIDRICGAEGALFSFLEEYGKKFYSDKDFIIYVDCGTATTVNVISYNAVFGGGLIAPGIDLMFNSLSQNTAQLPNIKISDYNSFIGKDTKSSMASGVVNSIAGLIEKSIDRFINLDYKNRVHLYLTGGNSDIIKEHINFSFKQKKELVLLGIRSVYLKNKAEGII